MNKLTIGLCLPTGDSVKADFALSLFAMDIPENVQLKVFNIQYSLVCQARETLVEDALAAEVDYILFIDSDIKVPKNFLTELLNHNKAIVCCNYSRKAPPYCGATKAVHGVSSYKSDVAPLGGALIKASVFEQLEKPYFPVEYDGNSFIGEDIGFCNKVIEKGFEIIIDNALSYQLGHIGSKAFYL